MGIRSVGSEHEPSIEGFSIANVLLGLLIILAAVALAETTLAFWNTVVVGVLVTGLAAVNAWMARRHRADRVLVPAGVNVLLGVWLAASVLVVPMGNIGLLWANVLLGLLVASFAAYNTWAARRDHEAVGHG